MRRLHYFILTFLLMGNLVLAQDSEQMKEIIQEKYAAMGKAMGEKDAAKAVEVFASDATFKLPGAPLVKGRDAIAKMHEKMIADGMKVKTNTKELERMGNLTYETGTYQVIAPDGNVVDQGYYGTLWKKDKKDGWVIYKDMVSSGGVNTGK